MAAVRPNQCDLMGCENFAKREEMHRADCMSQIYATALALTPVIF
jgi:hypothetical protein